jgi:hypothetical protein
MTLGKGNFKQKRLNSEYLMQDIKQKKPPSAESEEGFKVFIF